MTYSGNYDGLMMVVFVYGWSTESYYEGGGSIAVFAVVVVEVVIVFAVTGFSIWLEVSELFFISISTFPFESGIFCVSVYPFDET